MTEHTDPQDRPEAEASLTQMPAYVERAAAGALILDPSQLDKAREWLDVADFTDPTARRMYDAALTVRERGEHVDQATVLAELQRTGQLNRDPHLGPALGGLDSTVPNPASGTVYARSVLEASVRRDVEAAGIRLQQTATSVAGDAHEILALADEHAGAISAAALRWEAAHNQGRPPIQLSAEAAADATAAGPVDYSTGRVVRAEDMAPATRARIADAVRNVNAAYEERVGRTAATVPDEGTPERAAWEARARFCQDVNAAGQAGRPLSIDELAHRELAAAREIQTAGQVDRSQGVGV